MHSLTRSLAELEPQLANSETAGDTLALQRAQSRLCTSGPKQLFFMLGALGMRAEDVTWQLWGPTHGPPRGRQVDFQVANFRCNADPKSKDSCFMVFGPNDHIV